MNILNRIQIISSFLLLHVIICGQNMPLNVQQVAHVPTASFQVPTDLSDIWGWVDSQGNEYALVGTNEGTSIFSLANPSQPVEVFFEQGMNSIWRDIKTFGNYAYVTTEAPNGLLIIDMSGLPSNTNLTTHYYTGPALASWQKAHNLFIDDRGYAYIFGANRGNKGCIILDLNQNPTQPTEVADIDNWYVHDGMVKGDTLYLAHVSDGFFSIWDVSNPSVPVMLGQQNTLGAFCHNVWVSDDGDYLYTTDEISDGFIGEYDISDLNNIQLTDEAQTEPGQNVIPHNTHFLNNYIITSYYTSGITVHDVANKGNMVEVGSFDTSPNFSGNGFFGCWGVYPWLPSGLIIASDIEEGLYVLQPNYVRGAYLEGSIRDASNNQTINGVDVTILGPNETTQSETFGNFSMGIANPGNYHVVFSHPLYQSDTIFNVPLQNDSTTFLTQLMFSLTPLNLTVETKDSPTSPLTNVEVEISNEFFTFNGTTDSNGQFLINNIIPGSYAVYAGKWGYKDYCTSSINITDGSQPFNIILQSGYLDRFNVDQGWIASGNSPSGLWERAKPTLTTLQSTLNHLVLTGEHCNPGQDSDDCGTYAYVTGNLGGLANTDDVDVGYVKLTSPTISLDNNQIYSVNLSLWWKNLDGTGAPDDTLFVRFTDSLNTYNAAFYTYEDSLEWFDVNLPLNDDLDKSSFQIEILTAESQTGNDHVVEAGVDYFSIQSLTGNFSISDIDEDLAIFPNPTYDGKLFIKNNNSPVTYEVYHITGELVQRGSDPFIQLNQKGIYFIRLIKDNNISTKKVIY